MSRKKNRGPFSESICIKCLVTTDIHIFVNTKNVCQLSKIPSICKKQTAWQICVRSAKTDRMRRKDKFIDVTYKQAGQRIPHERLKSQQKSISLLSSAEIQLGHHPWDLWLTLGQTIYSRIKMWGMIDRSKSLPQTFIRKILGRFPNPVCSRK